MQKVKLVALGMLSVLGFAACDGGGAEDKPKVPQELSVNDCSLGDPEYKDAGSAVVANTVCKLGEQGEHADERLDLNSGEYAEVCRRHIFSTDLPKSILFDYEEGYTIQKPEYYGRKAFRIIEGDSSKYLNVGEDGLTEDETGEGVRYRTSGSYPANTVLGICAVFQRNP